MYVLPMLCSVNDQSAEGLCGSALRDTWCELLLGIRGVVRFRCIFGFTLSELPAFGFQEVLGMPLAVDRCHDVRQAKANSRSDLGVPGCGPAYRFSFCPFARIR